MKIIYGGLLLAMVAAFASWGVTHLEHGHVAWKELIEPQHIFSLVGVLASVYGAWRSGKDIGSKAKA